MNKAISLAPRRITRFRLLLRLKEMSNLAHLQTPSVICLVVMSGAHGARPGT